MLSPDVRLFARKFALFALPFLIYGVVVAVVDPYRYFGAGGPVDPQLKREIAFPLNYALWKMVEYRRDPQPNILLGDSRMINLDTSRISDVSGLSWYNFAYGGGSLGEAFDTFAFAASSTELQRVVIGVDIGTWNGNERKDRVSEAQGALKNPLLYLLNRNVSKATGLILRSLVTGKTVRIGKPVEDREGFWRRQLEVTARGYFEAWSEPVDYRARLRGIARTCQEKGIELEFVIFPVHADLLAKVGEYGLDGQNAAMRRELASLGTVYDFGWVNESTIEDDNFRDPFHQTAEASDRVIRTVWGDERLDVRVLGEDAPIP